MSYVMVRMYSGKGAHSIDELSQIAEKELAPQLMKAGCQRYTTVAFSNGTVGSTSLYKDKAAADGASQIANQWAGSTGAMEGYKLTRTMRGEHVYGFHPPGNPSLDKTFGAMRIYKSTASAHDVKDALEQEALPILEKATGLLRYTCFRTDEGDGFVVMTANQTSAAAKELTGLAREAAGKGGSRLQKVFPDAPEVIEGELIQSLTG